MEFRNIPDRIADKKWQFGKISASQIIVFLILLPSVFGLIFGITWAFSQNLIISIILASITIPFSLYIGFAKHKKSHYPLYKHLFLWFKSKFKYNNYRKEDETIVKFSTYNIKPKQKQIKNNYNEIVRNPDGSYSDALLAQQQEVVEIEKSQYANNILALKDLANHTIYLSAFKVGEIPISTSSSQEIEQRINDLHLFLKSFRIPFSLLKINQPLNLSDNQTFIQQFLMEGKNSIQKEILEFDLNYSKALEQRDNFTTNNWYILFFSTNIQKTETLLSTQPNLAQLIHTDLKILSKSQIKNVITAVFSPWVSFDDQRLDDNDELADLNPLFKFAQTNFEKDHFSFKIDLASILKDYNQLKSTIDPTEWEQLGLEKEYYYNISTLDKYPLHPNIPFGWLQMLSTGANSVIINCIPADPRSLQKDLKSARDSARALILQQKDETQRRSAQFLYDSYDNLTTLVASGDELIFNTKIFFVSIADSKKNLEKNLSVLQSQMQPYGFTLDLQWYQQDKMVHNIFPQTTYTLAPIQIPMPAFSLAFSFPFNESYYNDPSGIALGFTQYDENNTDAPKGIFNFDLFAKSRPNANQFVIGQPGGGKSTYLKKTILHNWAKGTTIISIDPENEYAHLCKMLGVKDQNGKLVSGAINIDISTTPINPLEINDFTEVTLPDGSTTFVFAIREKVSWLSEWISNIIFTEKTAETETASKILEEYLNQLYSKHQIHTLTDVLNKTDINWPTINDLINLIDGSLTIQKNLADQPTFLKEEQLLLKSLNLIFGPNSTQTEKILWSGATSDSLPNLNNFSFINFNISALSGLNSKLQASIYTLMLDFSKKQMQHNRLKNEKAHKINPNLTEIYPNKFILVVDEAHLLMVNNNFDTLSFLVEIIKRIRKYGGSMILATQNVQDFTGGAEKSQTIKIINNCSTSVVFGLKPTDIDSLNELLASGAELTDPQKTFLSRAKVGECLFLLSSTNKRKVKIDIDEDLMFKKYVNIKSTTEFMKSEYNV